MIAIVVFNWLFLALGLLVLVLNYALSRYTRDNIGYLTVILPAALVPVTIWSAISPETVLTPLPSFIVIFVAAVATANAITHEGLDPTIPALFVRPRPTTEMALYVDRSSSCFSSASRSTCMHSYRGSSWWHWPCLWRGFSLPQKIWGTIGLAKSWKPGLRFQERAFSFIGYL